MTLPCSASGPGGDARSDVPNGDFPTSDVIDAALTHLIESEENPNEFGEEPTDDPQQFNTSVLGLRYRTTVGSRYR